jgi:hypothetical protein
MNKIKGPVASPASFAMLGKENEVEAARQEAGGQTCPESVKSRPATMMTGINRKTNIPFDPYTLQ